MSPATPSPGRGPRVSWFIPVDHRDFDRMSASVWIRCLQLLPWLEKLGVRSTVNDPEAPADVAVFVRMQGDKAQALAARMKERGAAVVFDLVVNYFEEATVPGLGAQVTARHVAECRRMLDLADAVTCASAFIRDKAAALHPRALYLPDSLDPEYLCHVKPAADFRRERLRAVWSGYAVKARELEPLLPLLQARGLGLCIIAEKRPRLRLPGRFLRRRFACDFIPWRHATFPRSILEGEIFLGPRRLDTPYNLGHSNFKIGVFLAQGVPVLAAPVPSYRELLGEGRGGRLCADEAAWEAALDLALADREVLVRWSEEARAAVLPFQTGKVAADYAALFADLANRRPAA